jgi:hypothetical protein
MKIDEDNIKIIENMLNDKNDNKIWSLPQFHDEDRFNRMFKMAKMEYPNELDYILHMTCLSCLMDEDNQ